MMGSSLHVTTAALQSDQTWTRFKFWQSKISSGSLQRIQPTVDNQTPQEIWLETRLNYWAKIALLNTREENYKMNLFNDGNLSQVTDFLSVFFLWWFWPSQTGSNPGPESGRVKICGSAGRLTSPVTIYFPSGENANVVSAFLQNRKTT